ncbi:hypothetical protein SOVF_162310 [Spinacia oleracea]|uniref:Mogroside IE synthase n=1 Tax=Spinacia oleracea TaxID=3562 RepID=A0A9R0JVV5_SPIOL|nr:mogroside IE synthase-like [Spinacia oleracea]KNA08467.1 hypothetical protein SOVF_162310 [Spinacia oleracea]
MGICKAVFCFTNCASVCSLYWFLHRGLLTLPLTPDRFLVLAGLPEVQSSDFPGFIVYPLELSEYLGLIMDQFSNVEENDGVFINTFAQLESEIEEAMSEKWRRNEEEFM